MKKQIVVIGLGKFGTSVATELYQLGHDVLAIDLKDKNVQDMLGHVTYSVKVDATNETVLDDLGIRNFDVAVVSIGSDIQSSILVTVLLQSLGVPFIIARASDELHGNTLKRIGAHRVVFPENQTGKDIAHTLFNPNVMDYMDIILIFSERGHFHSVRWFLHNQPQSPMDSARSHSPLVFNPRANSGQAALDQYI